MAHDHPEPTDAGWENPDFCPFCGERLTDPGTGFMDHIEDSDTCHTRFSEWRENISGDMGSEWGG